MVPSQKYDVIHYLRETFLKGHNDKAHVAITPDYLAALPKGTSRGPAPSATDPWRLHDYGPFLAATIEVGRDHGGIVRKGFSVRLDPGGEGIGRGRAFAIHDLDTLRLAAVWTGDGFIDWEGINFDGRHGAHPHTAGAVQWFQPEGPGWADPATGSFDDPRGIGRDGRPFGPIPWARMRSVHHAGDTILLDYRVGDVPILESVRLEPVSVAGADGSALPVFTRSFSFGPRSTALSARLAPDTIAAALVAPAALAPAAPRNGCAELEGALSTASALAAPRKRTVAPAPDSRCWTAPTDTFATRASSRCDRPRSILSARIRSPSIRSPDSPAITLPPTRHRSTRADR